MFILGAGLIALGIIKSLSRRGMRMTIFDSRADDIAFRSRFVRVCRWDAEGGDRAAVESLLHEARQRARKPVLLVSGDTALRLACAHQDELKEYLDFVLPSWDAARTVLEKSRFAAVAERNAVPVPRSWNPSNLAELQGLLPELPEECLMKPLRSSDWQGREFTDRRGHIKAVRVSDHDALVREWIELSSMSGPPLIQEYVRGEDRDHFSYVSYIDRQGVELAGYCIRKFRLNPIHDGLATFATVAVDESMAAIGWATLQKLAYRGVASVCFKKDPVTGEARIFEINGRLPLAHMVSRFAGIDLPWLMVADAIGVPPEPIRAAKPGYWISLTHDLWAFSQYRRAGELSLRQWLRSLLKVRVIVEWDPRDPGPFLYWLKGFLSAFWAHLKKPR